jgi:hypothetical protein
VAVGLCDSIPGDGLRQGRPTSEARIATGEARTVTGLERRPYKGPSPLVLISLLNSGWKGGLSSCPPESV